MLATGYSCYTYNLTQYGEWPKPAGFTRLVLSPELYIVNCPQESSYWGSFPQRKSARLPACQLTQCQDWRQLHMWFLLPFPGTPLGYCWQRMENILAIFAVLPIMACWEGLIKLPFSLSQSVCSSIMGTQLSGSWQALSPKPEKGTPVSMATLHTVVNMAIPYT